ncbi:hypothetical protein G9A89_015222 [Geosiphon pyriformis]|nr:hypothetical protein G9A89_015222 [Geosiphon pyriformis]
MQQQYQQSLPIQPYQTPPTQQYQVPTRRLVQHNQFIPQNQLQKESDFQQTTLSEGKVAAPRSNPSNHTISPAQIAQNANLSDIFPFEFKANESPFLLSNAVVNEQKAITAMYTEATVKEKPIRLILDSGSAGSIITYQLMQQFKQNVDRPAQTVIVTADGMKKTSIGEIDDFPFTIDEITIPVKVLVIDTPQYQALKKVRYSTPEPQKEPPYIPLKYKNCKKKLSSMRVCISSEEEYETHTCYFCKACHREQFGSPKRSKKWDKTSCLICGEMLPEKCNWIDVAIRERVCDQICQYVLLISKKVRKRIPFDAVYNSALNKLYHYPHNAKIIFDLAIALINRATQEDVCQMKEAKYIEHTIELAGFDYEDEVKTYHQIASHTYLTKEAQIQQLEQINIQLCEEYVMPCDDQWCLECYALSIPLPDENDENEIEFGVSKLVEELPTTPIYLLEKQPPLQLKYFDNHGQRIRSEKAHEIDAGYNLRYSEKDTLVLQPKHTLLPNSNIILTTENYHFLEEKLFRINMGSLEPQQQRQLKQLIAEFADIFAKNNNYLGKTDIVQHQIHTGDAPPKCCYWSGMANSMPVTLCSYVVVNVNSFPGIAHLEAH